MIALRTTFAAALIALLVALFPALPFATLPVAQAQQAGRVPPEIAKLHVELREASRAYAAQDFDAATAKIVSVQMTLDQLIETPRPGLAEQIEPLYMILERVHGLLKAEGQQLPPLEKPSLALMARMAEGMSIPDPTSVPIPPTPAPTPDPTPSTPAGTVSFVNHVVPILTQRCGGCHVNKASGRFSMKDYATLMAGPDAGIVVAPGSPPGSRLLEVIEGKEMPPNGNGIPDQEYQTLSTWIAEGAKFDGPDPQTPLRNLTSGGPATPEPAAPMIAAATGDESVSFSKDVAPILVQNCNGCHFKPAQVRGGLDFTSFAGLMQGGDGGSPINPGDPAGSYLIGKLKGTAGGQQMPAGRPELSTEQIGVIEKWIEEGAKFDGPDPAMDIDQAMAIVTAKTSSPEELTEIRRTKSDEYWRLGLGTVQPDKVETERFMLYGNVGAATLKELSDTAEKIVPDVRKALATPDNVPLLKGKMSLFVTAQRYDYGEFSNMVERRSVSGDNYGHAKYTLIDAYGAVLPLRDGSFSNEALLAEQIAAIHAGAQGQDVPEWFYAGAGMTVASALYPDDPRITGWNDQISALAGQMQRPDDFLTGRVPPEVSRIASYSFVDYLFRDRRKFERLMNNLRDGAQFNQAFVQAFGGPPQQLAFVWAQNGLKRKK